MSDASDQIPPGRDALFSREFIEMAMEVKRLKEKEETLTEKLEDLEEKFNKREEERNAQERAIYKRGVYGLLWFIGLLVSVIWAYRSVIFQGKGQ